MSSTRKADNNSGGKSKGNLIYHSHEEAKKIEGGKADIVEKTVTHAEDTLFCKFYRKRNDKIIKYEVRAPSS
jgi:hypothetical protein